MSSEAHMRRFSAHEIERMRAAGELDTDWARVDAMDEGEVERLAAEDEGDLAPGWDKDAVVGVPPPKAAISLRLDRDVLDWFRAGGKGYQTRMNAALRAHVRDSTGAGQASRTRSRAAR